MSRYFIFITGVFLILLLTACERPAPGFSQGTEASGAEDPGAKAPGAKAPVAKTRDASATQAAFLVETEIARPSWTPTLTKTPSPTAHSTAGTAAPADAPLSIQVTPLPGMELLPVPEVPDFVFQFDPARWEKDPQDAASILVHQTIQNCSIESVPGSGLGLPVHLSWQDFGRFRFEVMDYGDSALVEAVQGDGLNDQGNSFLRLNGYNQPACRGEQEKVLVNLMTRGEAAGVIPFALYASPTSRLPLEGFSCPNTPPARLRSGDEVAVITDGLWLRSSPSAEGTKVRKFLRYPGVVVKVTGGPVCEKYVYWPVSITEASAQPGDTIQGWFAEGDTSEYYLMPVK